MRGFEQVPWLYDAAMTVMEKTGMGKWRAWLAQGARGRTLDLGCGTGRDLPLLPPGARGIGIDPELGSLKKAQARAPSALLVCASADALPFRDGTFDTVLCGLVLCSVPDASKALDEVKRVLAPAGQLRAMEHVRVPKGPVGPIQDFIAPAWSAVAGGCHPNRNTEATIEESGFEILPDGRRAQGIMRRFAARVRR